MAAAALAIAVAGGAAIAYAPSVADLDAAARAVGNRRDVAQRIGLAVFSTRWSAQVTQISANQLGSHLIVGIRLWGVKFHHPITRDEFVGEVVTLVQRTFAAAPATEEIDVWASVPIAVAKGVVVSGDLAKPTSRTVFSLTVRRADAFAALRARASAVSDGVFWDPQWSRTAFKPS
ncbi:MAG TPA: hypothetical protein VIW73_05025 [Candidatus Cybelea sp.]